MFWVGYSAASVRQCIGCASLCLLEEEPYIRRPQKPSGPNLLDEPLKGFIVTPACSPWKVFGSCKSGHMGIIIFLTCSYFFIPYYYSFVFVSFLFDLFLFLFPCLLYGSISLSLSFFFLHLSFFVSFFLGLSESRGGNNKDKSEKFNL